ncbi:mannose-1-phosphate guanylyltransferase/mannose-6-phosphate isomerase [Synechococcus sp. CCY9201]|uniref:mannose-1-phosphate guanylyltransferase/mannose-6-phosphate isomerase n=1 Tax=unclassified Synechococcus TaxID=2626047 RepID=UPI0018CEE573|nr:MULTISPECIES: mannose-1-phosphate guanylyltransferase/mannose-6-phosphate isomerase [unclassified Synechococcus]MEA5421893.1 mannose-1-phosphate guanylyltransferase/mannose-6-phosphate isomerase [Synechococcus sp. CCY9202]MEA5472624.1 mannose-1-phosphate guanylyltransferase/mannose-6-phosphate isomerase [Synechococcus sp. CCY9201]QPN60671.1 mannose-1-phosphate guanylyltransferase/mannose-6-phosphate isomerase [Synechococcus sp. CBW1002]QPN67630.1 mannose-1-phosphate guanylyltransferase/manno
MAPSSSAPLVPVILCGGTGTRLWPLSRASYPKQYWALAGDAEETLLQQTQQRLAGLPGLAAPLLICNEDHRFIVAEQMRQIGVEPAAILLEPVARNTAPAVAVAALQATSRGEDPLLLVLAADHVIRDLTRFRATVLAGIPAAAAGQLVTFGIVPSAPETGYGYIEAEAQEPMAAGEIAAPLPIRRFVEKPDRATAEQFLASGHFTWNSGMFLFRASAILAELDRLAPEVVSACRAALDHDSSDLEFLRLEREAFAGCPNVAIDVAVMEKTKLGAVLPLAAGWSDVGSWSALWETADQDEAGNVLRGRVISQDSRNCYLRSEHRLVVGLGVDDLVVVETDDVVLVAHRDRAQDVKGVVGLLERAGAPESKAHRRIYRPWGHYDGVTEGERWQVKKIQVKPGASLSLQMHHHRAEHWVVVKGTAMVEKDGVEELVGENQSTYIPLGAKHRLSNPGKIPVELIEVQSGPYLGEDDIVRFEDRYGRSERRLGTLA